MYLRGPKNKQIIQIVNKPVDELARTHWQFLKHWAYKIATSQKLWRHNYVLSKFWADFMFVTNTGSLRWSLKVVSTGMIVCA